MEETHITRGRGVQNTGVADVVDDAPEVTGEQERNVLVHLLSGKTISQIEALRLYGSLRLAVLIYRLRAKGYDIVTHREKNSRGSYHARYELVGRKGE